jgi:hypothetical protein
VEATAIHYEKKFGVIVFCDYFCDFFDTEMFEYNIVFSINTSFSKIFRLGNKNNFSDKQY